MPVGASPAAPSCNLHWILYDFNQAAIRTDAQAELATMAKILNRKSIPGLEVIDAHTTDAKGSDDYNKKIISFKPGCTMQKSRLGQTKV